MAAQGIDYSMGMSNVDLDTGIRFGVISTYSLSSWVAGEAEPIYPDTVEIECPHCSESFETDNLCPDDYQTCVDCKGEFQSRDLELLEPIGWDYASGDPEYVTESSETLNAVFVLKSPFVTYGKYCSPCAPGAVDLDSPLAADEGQKAYCFGHDYFEDGKAPYAVYDAVTGAEVLPEVA